MEPFRCSPPFLAAPSSSAVDRLDVTAPTTPAIAATPDTSAPGNVPATTEPAAVSMAAPASSHQPPARRHHDRENRTLHHANTDYQFE